MIQRIGIIGAGFARTTQIPGFRNCAGAQVVAIASAHRAHAEQVARAFEIPNVEDDWRSIVARDDIDLVSIVTPVVTHCEMTLAALDAGKAVLCEKPMAMNADEARRMMERARDAGLTTRKKSVPGTVRRRATSRSADRWSRRRYCCASRVR